MILSLPALIFSGCGGNDGGLTENDNKGAELVFEFKSRAIDNERFENPEDYFSEGETVILVSQRTSDMSLNFEEGSGNCYKYTYYSNPDADENSGFNFTSDNPLEWDKILENGQFSNGYAFGALFYPRGAEHTNEVYADQSNEESFIDCDVMGAWHRTSKVRDRLTFEFNHLMCRLQINLYIPLWDEEMGNGFTIDDNAVATALSFRTDYAIEFGDRTTELPPIARPSTTVDGTVADITMYKYDTVEEMELTDLSNFNIEDLETDQVKKFSFEMLFPEQTVKGNFLRFTLSRGDIKYNYLFNSAYLTMNADKFTFQAGSVTQLNLYLPRTDNEILLLSANINNWNDANANLTVTPMEEEEN